MSNPPPPPPPHDPPPPPPPGGYQPPPPPPAGYEPAAYGAPPAQSFAATGPSNGMGVAALVLGILSILTGLFLVGGLLGVLAVIFGAIGKQRANRGEATNGGMAVAGIVTGIIGIVLAALILVLAVFVINSDEFQNLTECLAAAETQAEEEQCLRDFDI